MIDTAKNYKILVVDGSPLFRACVKDFLTNNYLLEVEEIASAREFYHYLSTFGVSNLLLIILDIFLPDGSGLEIIRKFKDISGGEEVPFIVVSAHLERSTVVQAVQAGAKEIIAKPVNLEKLKEKIDRILSSKYSLKERKSIKDYYDQIRNEIKRAQRGNYFLSLVLAVFFTADSLRAFYKESGYQRIVDLENKYPEKLKGIMRETDSIAKLSPTEYLLNFHLPTKKKF